MRLKFTILLIVLNLALFGIIFIIEKRPETDLPGVGPVLPAGLVENADYLEIKVQDPNAHWILNKTREQWSITNPINWPANFFAVSRILNQLQFLEKESSFSVSEIDKAGRSLEDYGLVQPQAILTLGQGRNKSILRIGEPTGFGDRLYILSPDQNEVFVVTRELFESISVELADLRESKVFNIPLFEVKALRIVVSPGNTIVRIERNENQWNFLTPIQTKADAALVETAINRLTAIRATDFLSADLPGQGLDDASIAARVTIEGNNRRQTLLLGSDAPSDSGNLRKYAKISDNATVFTVPAEPFDNLLKAQETLREKKFVRFKATTLNEIEVAAGDRRVTLQKFETGGWQLPTKDLSGALQTWPAEPSLVNDLIVSLLELEAVSFPTNAPAEADLAQFGFTDPQRRITLRAALDHVLLLGDLDSTGDLIYAKMESEPFVYQVPVEILKHLQARALHFRSRVFHRQPKSAVIEAVTLSDLQSGENLFALDRQGYPGNDEVHPKDGELPGFLEALALLPENEREEAETLLRYSSQFKVKSYLRNEFSDKFNLGEKILPWKYLLKAKISLPGGTEDQLRTYNFYFTERLGGTTQIGGSPDYNIVFELNQELIDSLFTLAFRRETRGLEDVAPSLPETLPMEKPAAPDSDLPIESSVESDAEAGQ